MIRLLKGIVESKEERAIILFVNGVGYHVLAPAELIKTAENEIILHIHTHVREDALALYGFRTKKELSFFELLLTINGIGPKMALEILNQPTDQIQSAIFTGDLTKLTKIPGVGKKIAERLVLELKNKVEPINLNDRKQSNLRHNEINPDVIKALEGLGYKKSQIEKVLSETQEDLQDAESIIRYFLQQI
ncbi:Holliday junction branch migration protein RuvA [Candidatus Peregrinibacteria bacterium]|nr:Holliday junction branch migration protein RuvA [Candidatus Peregrinibacteria bacterium]